MCNILNNIRLIIAAAAIALSGSVAAQQLIPMPREMKADTSRRIHLKQVDAQVNPRLQLPDEGYTLVVSGSKAILRARTP